MTSADRAALRAVLRAEPYAVHASVSASGTPQAAVVGIVVSDQFEVFFDALADSPKTRNLRRNPAAAITIGSTSAGATRTVQIDGLADEPGGSDLDRLLGLYFERFPDGRERRLLPGITYWRVRPTWPKYSDYSACPTTIDELTARSLPRVAPAERTYGEYRLKWTEKM